MIYDFNDIKDIFNIIHDGDIVGYERIRNDLILKVEIAYLAERIRKGFSYFMVMLSNCTSLQFETWPNNKDEEPEIFYDINKILQTKLWVLSAEIKDNSIVVYCSQTDPSFNYCGGDLRFEANSAKVLDESGQEYLVEELSNLCELYWDEWEKNNKNKLLNT